jgi:BRCT domain type II-containing protein
MKQLVAKMRKVVADSQPNVYYDEMMAVVNEMEAALAEKTVAPAPKKAPKPASAKAPVEETVAKAVSKKATKKTKTSTEE